MLLAVFLGSMLMLMGVVFGSAGTYLLLRGVPEFRKRTAQTTVAAQPAIEMYPPEFIPSMEGVDPPVADPWHTDIGPPLAGSSDEDLIVEWEELKRALYQEDEEIFPEWVGR